MSRDVEMSRVDVSEKVDGARTQFVETLTAEERAAIERPKALPDEYDLRHASKLLRIHDAQAVTIENLKFRLGMVTADPESQSASLLSKHNALRTASENIERLQARVEELEALLLECVEGEDCFLVRSPLTDRIDAALGRPPVDPPTPER